MGKVLNGAITGGVGNLVFYKLNDEVIVRKMPDLPSKRTRRRKRTDLQWKQQARFKAANKIANMMKELLNQTFERKKGEIGKCQAISFILASAIKGEYPKYEIDFSNMLVARGRALRAAGVEVSSPAAEKLVFTWQDNSAINFSASDDQAIFVAYSEFREQTFFTLKGGKRSACKGELEVKGCSGKEVHVWMSFMKKNGETVDSVYLGKFNLLPSQIH